MKFTCPHCGQEMNLPSDVRNVSTMICPHCGKSFGSAENSTSSDVTNEFQK